MQGRGVVVVGASAGGVEALTKLAGTLPADLPAAVFVVLHTAPSSPQFLPQILSSAGSLPASLARDGEVFVRGRIYVAPADRHLVVRKDRMHVTKGPRENRVRPAIDPLFRSAAATCDSGVIGVVLTGFLDDGTAGLHTIKRCGGVAIVQDPEEAIAPEMPRSAIENVEVDYVLPLAQIGSVIDRLAREVHEGHAEIPRDVLLEVDMADKATSDIGIMKEIGSMSPYTCPECGGGLWQIKKDPVLRYRCQTGHAYTAQALVTDQRDVTEGALWAAIRALEERASMLTKMAGSDMERGRTRSASEYEREAAASKEHANALRRLLLGLAGQS